MVGWCCSVFTEEFVPFSVTSCSFAPVGWLLATGGTSGEVILYDVFSKKNKRKLLAHDLGVNWVEFYPCGTAQDKLLLATAGQDNTVKLWNVTINQRELYDHVIVYQARPVSRCICEIRRHGIGGRMKACRSSLIY